MAQETDTENRLPEGYRWKDLESQNAASRLEQYKLVKAFRGELVPQDTNDEPAEKLLARIQAERGKGKGENCNLLKNPAVGACFSRDFRLPVKNSGQSIET